LVSNAHWAQLLVYLENLEYNTSEVYSPSYLQFVAHQDDYIHLSGPDLYIIFSINIRKFKGQIPLIIHHNK